MRPSAAASAAVALSLGVAGCSSSSQPSSSSSSSRNTKRTLTVFAAASLQKTFTQIGKDFEKAHPGVTVKFNFAGSADLVSQIQAGATPDVIATADEKTMAKLTAAKLVTTPKTFAKNSLVIVTPTSNPAHISSPSDLTRSGIKLVVCAQQVPCGSATQKFEKSAHLTLKPVSEENSVTDVVGKVTSGEADAGIVYITDAKSGGSALHSVSIPDAENAINTYPIATVEGSKSSQLADQFRDAVTGASGQETLKQAGFTTN